MQCQMWQVCFRHKEQLAQLTTSPLYGGCMLAWPALAVSLFVLKWCNVRHTNSLRRKSCEYLSYWCKNS